MVRRQLYENQVYVSPKRMLRHTLLQRANLAGLKCTIRFLIMRRFLRYAAATLMQKAAVRGKSVVQMKLDALRAKGNDRTVKEEDTLCHAANY